MATLARPAVPTLSLVLLVAAAIFLNYVDRGTVAVAAPLMKVELGLSATGFGIAVSAFFWIYAPIQLAVGWLCDRFSVYRLLAGGLALWALSTMLMGLVGSLAGLVVLRLLLGIGESIAFPGSSKIICRHVPPARRGIANAAVAAGIALGPALGTLAGGLITAHYGWRPMFVLFGFATLLWLAPWSAVVRALPVDADHGGGSAAAVAAGQDARFVVHQLRPFRGQLRLLFPARLAAALSGPAARLLAREDDPAGDRGLCRPGGDRSVARLDVRSPRRRAAATKAPPAAC